MLNAKTPNESKKLKGLIDQYKAIDDCEDSDYWINHE
jgi:hypothetical protein